VGPLDNAAITEAIFGAARATGTSDTFTPNQVMACERPLPGQSTHDAPAAFWLSREGEFVGKFNAMPRCVESASRRDPKWSNTAVIDGTCSLEPVSLDPVGTMLSIVGIGGLVFGVIEGPEQGWTSPFTLSGLAVGVVGLVVFVRWELQVNEPILDPRLFGLRGFGTGSAVLFLMFLAMFGFFLVAMQSLQLMLGYSPLKAALAMLPQALLMMPIAAIAALLSLRVGQRLLCTVGLLRDEAEDTTLPTYALALQPCPGTGAGRVLPPGPPQPRTPVTRAHQPRAP
jgi:hypothetical protein